MIKFLIVIAVLFISFLSVNAQPYAHKQTQIEETNECECRDFHFLDLLFPLEERNFGDAQKETVFVLRFSMTPRIPDSQIIITKYLDGRVEIVKYSLQKSVFTYYPDNYVTGNPSCDQWKALAKIIPVERRTLRVSPQVIKKVLNSFYDLTFSPQLDTDLHFDGTRYDLWVYTPAQFAHHSMSAELLGTGPYKYTLVRWMNEVYKSIK